MANVEETDSDNDSLFPRAATYLLQMDPERRAYNFNKDIAGATGNLMLRTRENYEAIRTIFATVTEKYAPFDGHKVVRAIGKALGGKGYRGEIEHWVHFVVTRWPGGMSV